MTWTRFIIVSMKYALLDTLLGYVHDGDIKGSRGEIDIEKTEHWRNE
jgi:hypothetical protein